MLKLLKDWKRSKDIYSLNNDQKMKNIDNLISPCGTVVSVFLIEEDPNVGLFMFDKMFKDYEKITNNLKLLIRGKVKIKEVLIPVYIIKEKDAKKLVAHVFFSTEDKLYCLIFNLDKQERSLKASISSNISFRQTLKFVEANLWKSFCYIHVVARAAHMC